MKNLISIAIACLLFGLSINFPAHAETKKSKSSLRDDWMILAEAIRQSGNEQSAVALENTLESMTDQELNQVYGNIDLMPLTQNFLDMQQLSPGLKRQILEAAGPKGTELGANLNSFGLPSAQYPPASICPESPNRYEDINQFNVMKDISIANTALEVAQGVWSNASRVCEEVLFGFNGSLICIPVDIVLFAADLVVGVSTHNYRVSEYCDGEINEAELAASYQRLGHLHSDMEANAASIASQLASHDTAVQSQLATHDTSIKSNLASHDTDIKSQVATHDTDIKLRVATHDADIKTQLSAHDNDIKALLAQLQGAVDENQRLIKISKSRQLELMRLLITPAGKRVINPEVLSCQGEDCPDVEEVMLCSDGLGWPCK